MALTQSRIFQSAPRYRHFYIREHDCPAIGHLIPDTTNARKRALVQGATHFDALTFLRFDETSAPARRLFGDFYCRLIGHRFAGDDLFQIAASVIPNIFMYPLQADVSAVSITYVNEHVVGITIPASMFGMEDGSPLLDRIYRTFADWLQREVRKQAPSIFIGYDGSVDAANRPYGNGTFAVPLTWDEYGAASPEKLKQLSRSPREVSPAPSSSRFPKELLSHIENSAGHQHRLAMQSAAGQVMGNPALAWTASSPLVDERGALVCMGASPEGIKCALRILNWLRFSKISEFRQRDALRTVDGTFTLGYGAGEALNLLTHHAYIRVCEFPEYDYPGRRPSPWYIVSPAFGAVDRLNNSDTIRHNSKSAGWKSWSPCDTIRG
jgi:hypothetical protein